MQTLTHHVGVAAPLLRDNIDTDAIIPSREMKLVSKEGLGAGLFAGWRYTLPGGREDNPDFVLNQAPYVGTSILLSGSNFGCGSSREHAVWALGEYGIRVIVAVSFGSIFYNNCVLNGILPIELPEQAIAELTAATAGDPANNTLVVDLPEQQISTRAGKSFSFSINAAHKAMLIEGLDGIALTEQHSSTIESFEQRDREQRPWVYL